MQSPYLAFMLSISQFYHLPPRVLPSIQVVEAGQPGTISHNLNGTGDLGVMQVNTNWIPFLARTWAIPPRDVADRLIHDPYFNIVAAGAIMRIYMDEAHNNVEQAVGYYHSHTPWRASVYQIQVIRASFALFGRPRPNRVKTRRQVAHAGP
jgi:hypothetical protein